ncbi:hypothetical protein [Streptomyces sp. TBY4]|uniref:hypothetical protein n=1 Tax=Streptomyces sp. TBY4 TaxID=2962030 RepID=UPI0020B7DCF8|nr:hypothetical protein [Streptomyces sp. TBY4]MCP3758925.1 hypothetical protein [Streptomyces sp. TBY4]
MSTERIRHLVRTFRTAAAADGAASPSPAVPSSRSATVRDAAGGRDGSTPWTGEMAAPSFMILVAGPRR